LWQAITVLFCLQPLLSACGANGLGSSGGLVEERMMLPAQFKAEDGSSYTANLDTLVIRPDDGAKHPLAVVNMGISTLLHDEIHPDLMRDQTREFARRGWVAVTFTRRGWGHSEGAYDESITKCDTAEYLRIGRRAAEDIHEVVRLMDERPYVDASKLIVIGYTGGGTIAVSADPPPGLAAVIMFAGTGGLSISCPRKIVDQAFATYGSTSKAPSLWIHAENDYVHPEKLILIEFNNFTKAGGNGELLRAPAFHNDGAGLFMSEGIPVWTHYVDDFLDKNGLKLRDGLIDAGNGYAATTDR